jgi:hypothetical protein
VTKPSSRAMVGMDRVWDTCWPPVNYNFGECLGYSDVSGVFITC